jgi:tetratricopeptide (TPR) repeat protein
MALKNNRLVKLQKLEQERPSEPFIQFAIALEYQRLGLGSEAAARYQWLLDNAPDYTGTYYHFGKLYEQSGQFDKATETYQKGIEIAQNEKAANDLRELQQALNDLNDA